MYNIQKTNTKIDRENKCGVLNGSSCIGVFIITTVLKMWCR